MKYGFLVRLKIERANAVLLKENFVFYHECENKEEIAVFVARCNNLTLEDFFNPEKIFYDHIDRNLERKITWLKRGNAITSEIEVRSIFPALF